jgi:LPXTG-site transpeptidase (sortase) family protein
MFKRSNILLTAGILIVALGAGNAWWTYKNNHSPLDEVYTSPQQLDQSNNFLPMLQVNEFIPGGKVEDASGTLITRSSARLLAQAEANQSDRPVGLKPDRIVIPAINLDAPIVPIHYIHVIFNDQIYEQWIAPNYFSSGWQDTSALLGLPGNTVLNGHHNAYGMVFQHLIDLNIGDLITVYSGDQAYDYKIAAKMLLPERNQSIKVRLENARWIMPSTDERLTLITCWPADSNTHRVVIVAFPIKN